MTFAGSPDRVEARLVPEAGYELDTFRVSGLPRRPGAATRCGRLRRASRAPFACRGSSAAQARRRSRRRRLRRRADGARRLAAAHPGGADRGGRAPRPREPAGRAVRAPRLPRLSDRRARTAPKYRVVGRPIPRRSHAGVARRGAARSSGCRPTGRSCSCFGGQPGARALNELAVETCGDAGRPCCTSPASATTSALRARVSRRRLRAARRTRTSSARRSRRPISRLARRRLGLGARRGRHSRPCSCRTRTRPADHQTQNARYFERGGGAVVVPDAELGARPALVARAARRRRAAGARWREAMRALARPDAADEIAEELIALAARCLSGRRLWFVGIGGAGLSAYATLARPGAPRCAAGTARDAVSWRRSTGVEVDLGREPRGRPTGWEAVVSTAHRGRVEGTVAGRAPRRARRACATSIVVAGAHGKTTTAAMIAFVLDGLGLDPAFDRRRGTAARRQRRRAGSGWLVVEGDESDRTICALRPRSPSSRTSSWTTTRRSPRAAEVEELLRASGSRRRRTSCAACELEPGRVRARGARRAQPAERGGRARGARARRRRARRARRRRSRRSRRRPAVRARGEARRRRGLRRLRAPPGGGRGDARGGPRASGRPRARPLPAASLLADAAPRARARRRRSRPRDVAVVTDVYARARGAASRA